MDDLALTLILILAVGGFAWVIFRVVGTLGAGGESSARADKLAGGAGFVDEQVLEDRHLPR